MKELKSLQECIKTVIGLQTSHEDIGVLIEMAYDENDESLIPEIEQELKFEFKPFFRENMIKTMQLSHCTQEQAEQSPVTGRICYIVCTRDGQSGKDFPWKCWIFWMEMWQALRRLHFR